MPACEAKGVTGRPTWVIQVTDDREGLYRWSLVDPQGTTVYRSLDGYDTSVRARRAAIDARANISRAEIIVV